MNPGQPAQARDPLEAALTVKRRLGNRPGQIDSLTTLGTVYVFLGDVVLGLSAFEESRALCQALGDEDALARSEWATGGAIYEGIGEYERAIGHFQRALELSRKLRNRALECRSLLMIGAASVAGLLRRVPPAARGGIAMNFPMDSPVFQFFYWLVNTAGLGGIAVSLVGGGSVLAYFLTLRWIRRGGEADDAETYAYPTPALHEP